MDDLVLALVVVAVPFAICVVTASVGWWWMESRRAKFWRDYLRRKQ